MSFATPPKLSRAQVAEFQKEVDAIRNEAMSRVGQADVDHMRRMIHICRGSEVAGRALLHPLATGQRDRAAHAFVTR